MTEQTPAILADDLCAHYPGERRGAKGLALNGVSFDLPTGHILGVVGEAGSGKSTLARAIVGLSGLSVHGSPRISGGSLEVLGIEVRGIRSKAREQLALRVGYLPQDAGSLLDPHLTVGENVSWPIFARDKHFSTREAGELVATLIDAVHLPLKILTSYPHELSRGQRQRVALARALILEPALLVADDPTMGVDLLVRGAILDVIGELRSTREFSALIIAHEVGELRRITDRVMVMHQGITVALGTIDSVLADPRHPYVERLAREYRIEHPQQRLAGRARDLALRARLVE
ncbi:MAG: ATP-binding cassette domain-containing protein [Actinomycetota bacterium]|nr:ATP-binding cassette domain-containing protein [Actinomycetota bacterium]